MILTPQTLAAAAKCPLVRAAAWADSINTAMGRFNINTAARMGAFIAQIAHESGRFQFTHEIWNPKQCAWQARYEGRIDLGNVVPGDGERYRGRGFIQITGRHNYRECSKALGYDFEANPGALERREYAALSAAWFWESHGCNELADTGRFAAITKIINGGLNGQDDRVALWEAAKGAIT